MFLVQGGYFAALLGFRLNGCLGEGFLSLGRLAFEDFEFSGLR
jgi:hypothetical protein